MRQGCLAGLLDFAVSVLGFVMAQTQSIGGEYVTYKVMLGWLIGSGVGWASLVVSVGWIGWQVHLMQPHPGAATTTQLEREVSHIRELMSQNQKSMELQTNRIEKKLDSLINK